MTVTVDHMHVREGVWEGLVTLGENDDPVPLIEVTHLEQPVDGVEVKETNAERREWALRFPIPASTISDGVQTFLIRDGRSGETLDAYSLVAGQALEQDIRAEVDLLRAEVDMLKKAFRRHCLETG